MVLAVMVAGKLGEHNNGLYRSSTFRFGQEHSHLLSTQFKVRTQAQKLHNCKVSRTKKQRAKYKEMDTRTCFPRTRGEYIKTMQKQLYE